MAQDELGDLKAPSQGTGTGGSAVQILGLAILSLGVALLDAQSNRTAPDATEFVLAWVESLYQLLPFTAAILVGILYQAPIRRLLLVGVVITLAMVGMDFLPGSGAERNPGPPALTTAPTGELVETPSVPVNFGSAGGLKVLVRYSRGAFEDAETIRTPLGNLPSRYVLTGFFTRVTFLLIPLWAMGVVVGAISWVDRRILFRDPRDERVAYALFAWLLGPGAVGASLWLGTRIDASVVSGGSSYTALLIPHLLFGALGVLGWWTRSRQGR